MTRYVLDNDSVAHLFASGSQDHARSNNGNFYFHLNTLYSYGVHYPVAFLDRKNGIAYLNSDPSSVTTESKHKWSARRALRHFDCVYLPELNMLTRGKFCTLSKSDLAAYIQRIAARIEGLEEKRCRMRAQHRKDWNQAEQNELRKAAKTVWKLHKRRGDCFRVADRDTKRDRELRIVRELSSNFVDIRHRLGVFHNVLSKLASFPCRADTWAYNSALRQCQTTKDNLYPSIGFGGAGEKHSRKTAVRLMGLDWVKRAESTRDKYYSVADDLILPAIDSRMDYIKGQLEVLIADDLEKWVCGESNRAPNCSSMTLRIKGNELQTSAGARVPLKDAIRLTRATIACKKQSVSWKRNGERKPVGAFECDRITKQGDIIAGCHSIPWSAIVKCVQRFANVLPIDLVEGTSGSRG